MRCESLDKRTFLTSSRESPNNVPNSLSGKNGPSTAALDHSRCRTRTSFFLGARPGQHCRRKQKGATHLTALLVFSNWIKAPYVFCAK